MERGVKYRDAAKTSIIPVKTSILTKNYWKAGMDENQIAI